jgi:hypothetical protein
MAVNLGCYLETHGWNIEFSDVDDHMRLIRIREFFQHYDLSNSIISRSNVPFGCDLHWTRFYDFFLIIPSYILNLFLNSINQSIEYVGFVIAPIIRSVTIILFYCISKKLMNKDDSFLLAALMSAHPHILIFGVFGRPDHHALIMLFILIYLYSAIMMLETKFQSKKQCIYAAIVAAICVWISPETLISILLIDGILFVYTLLDSDAEKLKYLCKKNILIACNIGAIVFVFTKFMLDYLLAMCLLLLVAPYSMQQGRRIPDLLHRYWHILSILLLGFLLPHIHSPIEYDKISIVHMALFTFGALYFGIVAAQKKSGFQERIIWAIVWFFFVSGVFLLSYPSFLKGMGADIGDYVKEIWLNRVAEMRSPLAAGDKAFFLSYAIIVTISIVNKSRELICCQEFTTKTLVWQMIVANALCYTIFAGIAYRMTPYSALFGLPLIVDFCMNGHATKSFHRFLRIGIAAFFSSFFLFFTAIIDEKKEKNPATPTYTTQELFEMIDGLSKTPVVIMAHSNDGPPLLYYTKHSVVGASYHRQVQGIISSFKIMEGEYSEEEAKRIFRETGASYIFIRVDKRMESSKNAASLAERIVNKNPPDWVHLLDLPSKFNDVIIAKIDMEKL